MEIKRNKFLMIIASITLLATVVFFTYLIFLSYEKDNMKKPKNNEELNVSATGSVNNTINIKPTSWVDEIEAEKNESISLMDFTVDTTNSTTTNANYKIFLKIDSITFDKTISNLEEVLNGLNWKLLKIDEQNTIVYTGNFKNYSSKVNTIPISNNIPVIYGGSVDKYKLYIYLDENIVSNKNQSINLTTKLAIESNE